MELSDPKIEKVLNFLKNSFSFIWKMELFKRTSYISEGNFLSSKNKKTYTEKNSYISRNGTFCPKHKKFFIFFLRFFYIYIFFIFFYIFSGGNLLSLKKFLTLQEMKLFYIFSEKISVFNFLH